MGTSIQHLSDKVRLVASPSAWIEGKAIEQLKKTAQLDGVVSAVGLPDLHPGRGYPIGAAFLTEQTIYPALVGNDIGCGMAFWQTDIKCNKVHLDKFGKKLQSSGEPLDDSWRDYISERKHELGLTTSAFDHSLGTVGGGNHFAELQRLHEVYDASALEQHGVNEKSLQLLVHSGSRGLGQSILRAHVDRYGHAGLDARSDAGRDYLAQHDQALLFAKLNRELIALRICKALSTSGENICQVDHNLVQQHGPNGWLHRKGATSADRGIVMIPGSRGDLSYLVEPVNAEPSLWTLAHGAGRKWVRSECKGRLDKRFSVDVLSRSRFGSRLICDDKALIYEEAPPAYKAIDRVIDDMLSAGLIRVLASFRPVITLKLQGRGC
jgi:release factor H-coupled RctB family protein